MLKPSSRNSLVVNMLEIKNLLKHFSSSDLPAINDLNLKINTGEFVVILGSNGSGKSTLLKCLSGEYRVNRGKVFLDNIDVTKKKMHQRAGDISFVSQDTTQGTANQLTVLENMCLSMRRGIGSRLRFYENKRAIVEKKIKELGTGLERVIDKKISLLSGGQRQAISTLMAFEPIPKLLLLDEHTSALDPKSSHLLMQYTNDFIKQHKITTLMVTHNIEDAVRYGNRLIVMYHGKIIYDVGASEKSKLASSDIFDILSHGDNPINDKNQKFGGKL